VATHVVLTGSPILALLRAGWESKSRAAPGTMQRIAFRAGPVIRDREKKG